MDKHAPVKRGDTLYSLKWGECEVVKDASMKPGTKVWVENRYTACRGWYPVADFKRSRKALSNFDSNRSCS